MSVVGESSGVWNSGPRNPDGSVVTSEGAGSVHWNTAPSVLGSAGSQYVVIGWKRITNGSGYVLGTDWVEMRALTGT
jgi:hypothetical protein